MRDFAIFLIVVLAASLGIGQSASAAAYLGLKTSDAPAAMGGGALVAAAAPNSPAMIAGLMPNDIVIGIDGQRIANAEQLVAAVAAGNPGQALSLDVLRWDGQSWRRLAIRVTLGGALSPSVSSSPPVGATTPAPAATAAAPTAPAAAPIMVSGWTRAVEPAQQAFTFEIPQDWRFTASVPLARATASIVLTSTDGSVWLSSNDPRWLPLLNFPVDGSPAVRTSLPYIPAPYFIEAFGASLVGEQCRTPQLQRVRLREDIARGIDAVRSTPGGQSSAADAIFACERAGKPSLAFMAVMTYLYPAHGMLQFWQVDSEEIAIAPSDQIAAAIAIMNRSWSSVAWSQSWSAASHQVALEQTQAAARSLDQTLLDSHQVDNIINGVGDFFNPATNAILQAPAGFERYCQDGAGIVFGSNGGTIKPNCQQVSPVR